MQEAKHCRRFTHGGGFEGSAAKGAATPPPVEVEAVPMDEVHVPMHAAAYSPIHGNLIDFFSVNGAKALKNHRNLEWCKGKHVELEKR